MEGLLAGTRPVNGELAPSTELGAEGFEFGPAQPDVRQFAGEMDVQNRYLPVVMLSLNDPMALPDCSGVLLGPRLVLTAGSCVCALREKGALSIARAESRADKSSCVKRVLVTAVAYGEVGNPRFKERTTDMQFHTSAGSVSPHPSLELILDPRGFVVRSQADLATIVLDEPMEEEASEVLLARDEAQVGEALVMAGYGHDEIVGGFHGVRYSRKNKVVGVTPSEGGRIQYEQQGAAAYNGFDGGPCFREAEGRRWLVGVARARADRELVCTSTVTYEAWLHSELQRAKDSRGSKPPGP
ncbi:trypsin-like serine protease [Hyalangium gracile]|uniref:trypsin-like serine protease n=1 Tax=Hyalangium gracile TaxID=394092 RepID=UPI001CCCC753|nr:trypsin-like peptidase domain-containing protein [Hyalangium gracile]